MQAKRKSVSQTHKLSFDTIEVLALMRLYCNNRILTAQDLGGILSALEAAYWQGKITWPTVVEVQTIFFSPAIAPNPHASPCPYLQLALEYAGRVVKSRYLLQEVIGFVDAGVMFRATDIVQGASGGGEVNSILCLLEEFASHTDVLTAVVDDINNAKLTSCVSVQKIIKDNGQTFLILPALAGVPLSSWLADRESNANWQANIIPWLRQFKQWLHQLAASKQLRKAIHPGQVWVDVETKALTAVLLPVPEILFTPLMRAAYYQSSLLENNPKLNASTTYQLMAIGCELYTGSAPDVLHFKTLLARASTMPKRTAQALHKVLLENRIISWRSALGKLGISKVGLYCRRVLVGCFASVLILFAIDMGMRYWPQIQAYMTPEITETTVVLTPETKDQHINSLKAAFFNQVAEQDIVGARSSLEALEQILPDDDVFIEKIAPQQLAESYLQAAKQVAASDRVAAGLLVRAAERLAPTLPALKTPEVVALQLSAKELASITEETASEEKALMQSAKLNANPSTKASASVAASASTAAQDEELFTGTHSGEVKNPPITNKSAEELGLKTDPCLNAFLQKGKTALVHCADALDQTQLGPRLIVLPGGDKVATFAITQQPISLADYQVYCKQTPGCSLPATAAASNNNANMKLDDVAASIQKYNAYCAETGACAALSAPQYVSLTQAQIKAYIEWMTRTTGYQYRLPTKEEWDYLTANLQRQGSTALHWGMIFPGSKEWAQTAQGQMYEVKAPLKTDGASKPDGTVFRLVRELIP